MLDLVKESVLVNGWVEPTCAPSVSLLDLQVSHDNLALLFAVSDATGPAELGIGRYIHSCSSLYIGGCEIQLSCHVLFEVALPSSLLGCYDIFL